MNDEAVTPVASSRDSQGDHDARALPAGPRNLTITIDCGRCVLRGVACSDCVIGVLVGPALPVEWDETELRAIEALVEGGLVPKLRLTPMPRASRWEAA